MKKELPLCECGCGERVVKEGNKFIHNHHRRGKEVTAEHRANLSEAKKNPKPKPESQPCKCGCGELANPGYDYILGHYNKGRKKSIEHRTNLSKANLKEKEPLLNNEKINYDTISKNKRSPRYLGCYVAEQILSKVFKNVKIMPSGNHGYDFICNNDKKIDVKSSATENKNGYWHFNIEKNQIADYFLFLAFNNRKDLDPVYLWLIPGHIVNHRVGIDIRKSTFNKWSQYELPLDKVILCCDKMRTDTYKHQINR